MVGIENKGTDRVSIDFDSSRTGDGLKSNTIVGSKKRKIEEI